MGIVAAIQTPSAYLDSMACAQRAAERIKLADLVARERSARGHRRWRKPRTDQVALPAYALAQSRRGRSLGMSLQQAIERQDFQSHVPPVSVPIAVRLGDALSSVSSPLPPSSD